MSQICQICDINKDINEFYIYDFDYYSICKNCCKKSNISQCIECYEILQYSKFYTKTKILAVSKKCIECFKNLQQKQCCTCEEIKKYDEFYKHIQRNTYRNECKKCTYLRKKKWRSENKEYHILQTAEYRNRPEVKDRNLKYQKEYYRKPGIKEHKAELAKINDFNKYHNDPNFRLKKILRSRLNDMLKGYNKSKSTFSLLGCNLEFLKKWLEYQFDTEMSWNNQGSYWHIDHIKPCASFDLNVAHNQELCFNWKNLRPMYSLDNISKKDTYNNEIKIKSEIMLKSFIMQNKIKI